MSTFKVYLIDSLGNKLFMNDLTLMFGISNSHTCKLIRDNEVNTLKGLVDVVNRPRKVNYPDKTVYIKNSKGMTYTLKDLIKKFDRSISWAYTAHKKYGCVTYEDFEFRATGYNKPVPLPGPTMSIDDIPVGTWERDNYKCPPANTKSSKKVLQEIEREESGACSNRRWHDKARRVVKRRHVTYTELKEAGNILDQIPLLSARFMKGMV